MGEIIFNGSEFKITLNAADGAELDLGGFGQSLEGVSTGLDQLHADITLAVQFLAVIVIFFVCKALYNFFAGMF